MSEFANGNLGQIIHEAMVKEHLGDKLHLDCIDGDIPVSAFLASASANSWRKIVHRIITCSQTDVTMRRL